MGAEQLKFDRRRLIVLGAAAVLPGVCGGRGRSRRASGIRAPATGLGGREHGLAEQRLEAGSSSAGGTSTSSNTSTGEATSTSSTSSSGHSSSSSSTSSSGQTSTSSSSSSSTSSTSGGTTCPTPANSQRLNFSQYASLQNTNGSASFSGSGFSDSNCQQPNIIVVNRGSGQFVAFSASCSHACCIVKVKSSEFYCNCHGATFNISTGAVTGGPAGSPLDVLQVCADSTGVVVSW